MNEPDGCEYGPLLSALHDGELPSARRVVVADHAMACPACAAELAAMRRPSGRLADRPLTGARARSASPPAPSPAITPRRVRVVRRATAVAAVVFAIAVVRLAAHHHYAPTAGDRRGDPARWDPPSDPHAGHGPSARARRPAVASVVD